jgi:hypothetical protein
MMKDLSRRSLLKGSALLAGAGAVGVTQLFNVLPAAAQFNSDLDVLNYALTLEHLEAAFYRDGLARLGASAFSFVPNIGPQSAYQYFTAIRDHELAHVATLTQVITQLGGTPVGEASYNFGYSDARGFVQVAQALENTGVSAYDGAIRFVSNPDLKEAAATIATVEARHAAYLNLINNTSPFPAAFDTPKSQAEVLAIAGPFIVANAPSGSSNMTPGVGVSITSPSANQVVTGPIAIVGTAQLQPGDQYYKVEIQGGQFGNTWTTVGTTHNRSVNNGQLEFLNAVQPGSYQLRVVTVNAGNFAQVSNTVSFTVR